MVILPPIRIKNTTKYIAQNGPLGVKMSTSVRNFTAVLAQEVYEGWRYMFWYWVPFLALLTCAVLFFWEHQPWAVLPSMLWIVIAGQAKVPTIWERQRRELMGQAVEIAAIGYLYGGDVDAEIDRQTPGILRFYPKKHGYFVGWTEIDVKNGLRSLQPEALAWVKKHESWLRRFMEKYG